MPGDLIDSDGLKLCPIHSKPIELVDEDNWFFKLSEFRQTLLDHYKKNPESCEPESARNEIISFLEGNVEDLSISRSTFDWGIPVPWDSKQVVYVWFDALLNYATAVGIGDEPGSEGGEKFSKTWPADVHLVGKDILRFHAVIWPAMLLAAGETIPKKVFAHGWLLVGGEKMSKSKHNFYTIEDIRAKGIDPLATRLLFMQTSYRKPLNFTWEALAGANKLLQLRLINSVNLCKHLAQRPCLQFFHPLKTDFSNVPPYSLKLQLSLND